MGLLGRSGWAVRGRRRGRGGMRGEDGGGSEWRGCWGGAFRRVCNEHGSIFRRLNRASSQRIRNLARA